MLEFAREQYLWLFALVALFFIVFFLARRWKKARVTYGFIWDKVSKRTRPPTWKRLLRLILTLVISGAMLSSAALYAAGLGPRQEDEPAPLLVFIVIDNSPSMRGWRSMKEMNSGARSLLAQRRAREIIDALSERDRALVVHFRRGLPVTGPWVKRGGEVGVIQTDFAPQDLDQLGRLCADLDTPPDVPALPKQQKVMIWLCDEPPKLAPTRPPARLVGLAVPDRWRSLSGIPVLVETFGSKAYNDGVVAAAFVPALPASGLRGYLDVKVLSGKNPGALLTVDGKPTEIGPASRFEIPLSASRVTFAVGSNIVADPADSLQDDDSVFAAFDPSGISVVLFCHAGAEANDALLEGLKLLLPGREIKTRSIDKDRSRAEADLVVLDQVSIEATAKILLCFGALPPSLGEVQAAREAKAGLFDTLTKPDWLGFEVPNMQLLAGRQAFPLKPGHKLTPLATHVEVGVLIAAARGEQDVLYVGYSPTQSNFLFVPEGPTLLQRWLNAGQSNERLIVPPFCRMDQSVEIKLDRPEKLTMKLTEVGAWDNAIGAREYEITPGPDGRAKLGPFEQPGQYAVSAGGGEIGIIFAYWVDEKEQTLPYTPLEPLDLSELGPPARERSWIDWFPEVLLWIALCGLVLEWICWLAGVTD